MKEKNFIDTAINVIKTEAKAVKSLADQIRPDFESLCKSILDKTSKTPVLPADKEISLSDLT